MPERTPIAFVSCRFVPDELVKAICNLLEPEIHCVLGTDLFLQPIPPQIRSMIDSSDLLLAIITQEGDSPWIQNELGMAYAMDKPILVFYEEGVSTSGFASLVSEYVQFNRSQLARLANDKTRLINGIKAAVSSRWRQQEETITVEEQKRLGVVGIYPDRREAFDDFRDYWLRESKNIYIVSSTLEGFRNFIRDSGPELVRDKLIEGCDVRILLTHKDFIGFRARNEGVREISILTQLDDTLSQLKPLMSDQSQSSDPLDDALSQPIPLMSDESRSSNRRADALSQPSPLMSDESQSPKRRGDLRVRWFKNPPTCFAVMTESYMLLNPYPYMRTAYSSFAVVVRRTDRANDIFRTYFEYHFRRAWVSAEPVDFSVID